MAPSTDPADGVTVGIDLGDRYSHFCELDAKGDVVEEGRLATSPTAFRRRFSSRTPARVAIEAGAQSAWVARLLKDCGHEVLVANPARSGSSTRTTGRPIGSMRTMTVWVETHVDPSACSVAHVRRPARRLPDIAHRCSFLCPSEASLMLRGGAEGCTPVAASHARPISRMSAG